MSPGHKKHILLTVLSVFFLASCVEEMDYYEHPSEYITFVTGVGSYETRASDVSVGVSGRLGVEERDWHVEAGTKAAPVVSLTGDAGIIAYQYVGNWDDVKTSCSSWDMLTNAEFAFEGNMLTGEPVRWTSVPDRKDEKDNRLKVFAYAPYVELTVPGGSLIGVPSIPYEIKSVVASQEDLIEAEADVMVSSAKGMSIPLDFRHVLTAVRFKMGFAATVESVNVRGVYGSGIFTIGSGWTPDTAVQTSPDSEYVIDFDDPGKSVKANEMLTDDALTLMLMPQTLTSSAEVEVTYNDGSSDKFSLAGKKWTAGRMVTYTLYDEEQNAPIYFDLAAGNVRIGADTYSGKIYVGGEIKDVSGDHENANVYYVYQSTGTADGYSSGSGQWKYRGAVTGWNAERSLMTIPDYPRVESPDKSCGDYWTDFITDNTSVESVIEAWDDGKNVRTDGTSAPDEGNIGTAVVRDAGRTHTSNYILVEGSGTAGNVVKYNLTIDDIYSVIQVPVNSGQSFRNRNKGGIAYIPSGYTELNVSLVGDNRMGCMHIHDTPTDKITIGGTGSLTAADADFMTVKEVGGYTSDFGDTKGYISNFWNSAIGNNTADKSETYPYNENLYNLYIDSGVIFAGTTKTEDATAIGGGGNGYGQIYITGGSVTAVATTAGTAIGGGMGHTAKGGPGEVHVTGGNVYAYNLENMWGIPSSAIGGGGSMKNIGSDGVVNISGGNIYAYSALGTAIGGGSSSTLRGGNATIDISGGHIIAKSGIGSGIGGGSGGTVSGSNGGSATVRIYGNPVIRTGSVGGGKTENEVGTIGSADIEISGGDISAQFVMAAGASVAPEFIMSGGVVRNSNTAYGADDYYNVVKNGGAVYMEDGSFIMSGGTIMDCSAEKGGAVYISKGANANEDPKFVMSGGTIKDCVATGGKDVDGDGGAVYLENGSVEIDGTAAILHNRSEAYGGAVCVRKTATSVPYFTMSGGQLGRNTSFSGGGAVYIDGGNVTVSGGEISGNIVEEGNGGAICINSGSFIMSEGGDAVINGNVAQMSVDQMSAAEVGGYGGGVYVTSTSETVEVDIFSGRIEGNSSAKRGGGIAVDMPEDVETKVIVGKDGSTGVDVPDITGNITLYEGGGLYVNGNKADVVINSGRILNNRTVGYVPNPDVVNLGGMVTLNGGDVEYVTVTYDGNGAGAVSSGGNPSESQKIVTDTNNRLRIPEFTRSGYRFVRWNTRRDGLGPKDYVNDEIVKRSSDLTLYAIWVLD